MSDIDTAIVRARANAATKGPWKWRANEKGYPQEIVGNDDGLILIAETFTGPEHFPSEAEFIAHARTDIPELCDEVDMLRQASRTSPNIMAAMTELVHHGDLTPSGRRVLERIIGGES